MRSSLHRTQITNLGSSNLFGRAKYINALSDCRRTKLVINTAFSTAHFGCRAGVPKSRFPSGQRSSPLNAQLFNNLADIVQGLSPRKQLAEAFWTV